MSKPPKNTQKQLKQASFNKRGNCILQKECDNSNDDNTQKVYESMAKMSGNDEIPSRNFGDSSQLTNQILDSGATCHTTP